MIIVITVLISDVKLSSFQACSHIGPRFVSDTSKCVSLASHLGNSCSPSDYRRLQELGGQIHGFVAMFFNIHSSIDVRQKRTTKQSPLITGIPILRRYGLIILEILPTPPSNNRARRATNMTSNRDFNRFSNADHFMSESINQTVGNGAALQRPRQANVADWTVANQAAK